MKLVSDLYHRIVRNWQNDFWHQFSVSGLNVRGCRMNNDLALVLLTTASRVVKKSKPLVAHITVTKDRCGRWAFAVVGPQLWNQLPVTTRAISVPIHQTVSSEHWRCSSFNEWASSCRWQQIWRNAEGCSKGYNINILNTNCLGQPKVNLWSRTYLI